MSFIPNIHDLKKHLILPFTISHIYINYINTNKTFRNDIKCIYLRMNDEQRQNNESKCDEKCTTIRFYQADTAIPAVPA